MIMSQRSTARSIRIAVAALVFVAAPGRAAESIPADYVDWACALKVPGMPCNAGSDELTVELKLSVAVAPAFPLGAAAKSWAEAMGAAASGRIEAKLHPGAALAQRDAGREYLSLIHI